MSNRSHPAAMYLRLSESPDDLLGEELSRTRRSIALVLALLLLISDRARREAARP